MNQLQVSGSALALLTFALIGCGGSGASTPNGIGVVVPCYNERCLPSGGGTATPPGGGGGGGGGGGATPTPPGGGGGGGGGATPTPPGGGGGGGGGATPTPPGGGGGGGATPTPPGGGGGGGGGGGTPTPIAFGALTLNPTVLIPVGITNTATATTVATQSGYTGAFTPTIACPANLPLGTLTASASGSTITVSENTALLPALLGANVFCTLTVAGGGGMTATATVLLGASILPGGSPPPTTSPSPGATPGALTVAPAVLIPIGVGTSTTTATIAQVNYAGPFSATIQCPINLPTGALSAAVSGNSVVITENATLLQNVLGLNLLCTLTVTGGGGMTGTANILLGALAL